jgi:hypothetical protein
MLGVIEGAFEMTELKVWAGANAGVSDAVPDAAVPVRCSRGIGVGCGVDIVDSWEWVFEVGDDSEIPRVEARFRRDFRRSPKI